jgi:hypothetical protein
MPKIKESLVDAFCSALVQLVPTGQNESVAAEVTYTLTYSYSFIIIISRMQAAVGDVKFSGGGPATGQTMHTGVKSCSTIVSEDSSVVAGKPDEGDDDVIVAEQKERERKRRSIAEIDEDTMQSSTTSDCGEDAASGNKGKGGGAQPAVKRFKTGVHRHAEESVADNSRCSDDGSAIEGASDEDDGEQKEAGDDDHKNDDDVDNGGGADDDDDDDDDLDDSLHHVDLEEEEDSGDEAAIRRLLAAAQAQGISLEYLAGQFGLRFQGFNDDDDDDEALEYPFETPPQSLEDVATFIQSERCKRILVLAG